MTAIQRASSTNTVPDAASSVKVDLSSLKELTAAFKNQDVVISAVPSPKLETERVWMDAAVDAGVKRIMPSEFSTNLETQLSRQLPIVKDKLEIRKYVEELATAGKVEWTTVNNGPFFLNFIWTNGWMGPNPAKKFTTYHDGGDKIVCTSTLERIAEGVAKSIAPEHAASTRNKPVYVHSTAMSERKMTEIVCKVAGISPKDFKETNVSIDAATNEAYDALKKGDMSKMGNFYVPFCFGDGYGGDFRDISWNKTFGLKDMTETELEQTVKGWL